ncbi:MAG: hypothetical protein Q9169_004734 [Polycauliona sp. 2 TL-2023]
MERVKDDPGIFSDYTLWIYNQDWQTDPSYHTCCRLYVLAHKLGSEKLQNSIIDELCKRASRLQLIETTTFAYVYNNTLPGNPLRKLLADFLAWDYGLCRQNLVEVVPQCLYDALKRRPLPFKNPAPFEKPEGYKSSLMNEVVTIFVGPGETPFYIHSQLLTPKSAFFKAALAGPWRESAERVIYLPEDDPKLFGNYVLWVYDYPNPLYPNNVSFSNDELCQLYVLGDKLGSEAWQNMIIDKICKRATRRSDQHVFAIPDSTFEYVYDNTPPGSRLRKVLADFLAWNRFPPSMALVDVAPECLFDAVGRRSVACIPGPAPYCGSGACKEYHVHRNGVACPAFTLSLCTDWEEY